MSAEKKTSWIGTSWKMHKLLDEALGYCEAVKTADIAPGIQPFVIPPFTSLREVCSQLSDTSILAGAQNMHWDSAGPWTGEVSAPMLLDCGAQLVELGHSERREHFRETDATVGLKVKAALDHGLRPLICIGETLEDREQNRAEAVLSGQVEAALEHVVDHSHSSQVLFAYEPVWAIGEHGLPAESAYADAQQALVIAQASSMIKSTVPCLYGGSVNADNCEELITCPHIDGLFIGRAAWHVEGYLDILARCAAALKNRQDS